MPKFIITWGLGYDYEHDVVEAADQDAATRMAYKRWREEVEHSADYEASPYDQAKAIDLGLEDETETEPTK